MDDEHDEFDLDESLLNDRAWDLVNQILTCVEELRVGPSELEGPGLVLDFGVNYDGSLAAGLALAEVCTAGLAEFSIVPREIQGVGWPHLFVQTDDPLEACLLSQYAGWQISGGNYFAMGSGPMRAAACREPLFEKLGYGEDALGVVGVLESSALPPREVVGSIATACQVRPENVALFVAPTASVAGNLQVVARSVETALHKLFELDFEVHRIESACGSAPLSPVAADDLTGIGRTNDAILYGGQVTLFVTGDDESIREIGPLVPSCGSPAHGKPFLKLFEEAGRDFYNMDKKLFSPAQVVFQNLDTGHVHVFGDVDHPVLRQSFGF